MTELTFLVELLLNHKLPKDTRHLIAVRIQQVEDSLSRNSHVPEVKASLERTIKVIQDLNQGQCASTAAILAKNPDLLPNMPGAVVAHPAPAPAPIPVEQVAQNAATAEAMASRQQAINQAMSGTPEKGRSCPKKF